MELKSQIAKFNEVSKSARSRVYNLVLKHFQKHPDSPWSGKYLVELEKTIKAFYVSMGEEYKEVFRETLPAIMRDFYDRAKAEIKTAGLYKAVVGEVDTARIKRALDSTYTQVAMRTDKMSFDHIQSLRRLSADVFREVSVTGATRRQVSKELLERALYIKGFEFTDKGGNKWSNKSYFQMLARTELMNAGRATYDDKMAEEGFDIMRLTTSGDACDHCAKYEGKPFSLTGATPGIPTKQDLIDAGVFHPNCTHSYSLIPANIAREKYGIKDAKTQAQIELEKAEEAARKSKEEKVGKKKEFIPAQTMDEARKRISEITGSDVTLDGGTSLEAANALLEKYERITHKFPQLTGKFGAVFDTGKAPGKNAYAAATSGREPGLYINPAKFGKSMSAKAAYANDLTSGFHAAGTDWKSIFTHEIGHQVSNVLYGVEFPSLTVEAHNVEEYCKRIMSWTLQRSGAQDIAGGLSRYATKNAREFFSEAFAEYMDSPNPRPIAKAFGEVLEEQIGRIFKK